MRLLYNLAFIIFGIIYLPYLIVTKRYRYGLANRFGILSKRLKSISSKGRLIWIHAVSLGEMKAASILAPLLRKAFPSHTLVFSSVTHSGNKVAKTIATGNEEVFYLPFDISFIMDRVVGVLKPELFLCLETELWPNLVSSLSNFNTKIILINGRISNRSYFGYRKVRFVISRLFKKFSLILMQSDKDAVRVLTLGAPKDKVFVTGNLKFDLLLLDSTSRRREIREKLRIKDDDVLLVAGSTHRGEEEQLIECFSKLRKEYSNIRLFIAPRHVERTKDISILLAKRGLGSIRYSGPPVPNSELIYILDIIGELKTIYSASDIVFIGGSLVKKGGQNPIEPAIFAKPIIFGKFTFNFQDVVRSFLENRACIQVKDKDELYSAVRLLMDSPKERRDLGIKAKDTVNKNLGSSQRTIELILSVL